MKLTSRSSCDARTRTIHPATSLRSFPAAAVLTLLLGVGLPLKAQTTPTTFTEQYKSIKAPGAVATLGPDLFGDKVNLSTGGLEFTQTDVNLHGNNALPVAFGRRVIAGG